MKKIVFIDHSFHKKTKSSDFFKNILKEKFLLEELWDDSWRGGKKINVKTINNLNPDIVIFWQTLPQENEIKKIICRNIVYIPMENAFFFRDYKWLIYKKLNIKVFSFSKKIYNKISKLGLNCFYCQFFPEPCLEEFNKKNKSRINIFFWQRRKEVDWDFVKKIIGDQKIDKLYFKEEPDPFIFNLSKPSERDKKRYNMVLIKKWLPVEELKNIYRECNVFIVSRKYEGIGMTFLEAMSYGMAVIAPNNPTYNEYIINRKNGYLFDIKQPQKIIFANLLNISTNAIKKIEQGHETWLKKIPLIVNFISATSKREYLSNKEKFVIFIGKIFYQPIEDIKTFFKKIAKKFLWKILYENFNNNPFI